MYDQKWNHIIDVSSRIFYEKEESWVVFVYLYVARRINKIPKRSGTNSHEIYLSYPVTRRSSAALRLWSAFFVISESFFVGGSEGSDLPSFYSLNLCSVVLISAIFNTNCFQQPIRELLVKSCVLSDFKTTPWCSRRSSSFDDVTITLGPILHRAR